jgi:hypothetical protein
MPSTYTTNNGIELIATGEQSGTWGATTNTNLELLDASLDGQVTITLSSAGSSGSPNTLPVTNGSSSNGRNRVVIYNDGGDLGATAYVQLTPNDAEKIIYIRNSLSGSRDIIVFQGTYSTSNDYVVPNGTTAVVFFNGAGTGAVAANVFNNAVFDALQLGTSDISVDKILDQDDMSGNDASALATQQSIKAYVDSQVATADTLSEVLANGNTTGGTNILFGDNDKAVFGAGSDLQIFHDGSNSYVKENGTGNLWVTSNGTSVGFGNNDLSELYAVFNNDGEAKLFFNGVQKFATSSTGIDVTGTVTADDSITLAATPTSLDENRLIFNETPAAGSLGSRILWRNPSTGHDYASVGFTNEAGSSGGLRFKTASSVFSDSDKLRMKIADNGDISFFEDTGTTAKFFFDASAESLGIGNSSPTTTLDVTGVVKAAGTVLSTSAALVNSTSAGGFGFASNNTAFYSFGSDASTAGSYTFQNLSNDASINITAMKIDASGNIGIGTSSPSTRLHTDVTGGDNELRVATTTSGDPSISFYANGAGAHQIAFHRSALALTFTTVGSSERVRIDSSGNFLVATTDSDPSNNSANSTADNGIASLATGEFVSAAYKASANTGSVGYFNRTGTDGAILEFRKSGATVGSIATTSSRISIGSNDVGLFFDSTNERFTPIDQANQTDRDAAIDLGYASSRFKDLHLSNAIGNGAAGVLFNDGSSDDLIPYSMTAGDTVDNSISLGISSKRFKDLFLSGVSYNGDGSASAPSISFGADTNTGFYRVGSDQIGFVTAGSLKAKLDASGNLGIGTSSPQQLLHLSANNPGGKIRLEMGQAGVAANDVTGEIEFYHNDSSGAGVNANIKGICTNSTGAGALTFGTGTTSATERMRIDASGQVGIGETDPDSTLTVKGSAHTNFQVKSNSESTKAFIQTVQDSDVRIGSSTNHPVAFYQNGTERMRLDASGNLFVGKTNNTLSNDGTVIRAGGEVLVTNTSDIVANFNRTGTDGSIATFYKDGSTVGSIFSGHGGTQVGIGVNTTGITFNPSTRSLMPADPSSANPQLHATLDIGHPIVQWKDLYLSGTAYLSKAIDEATLPSTPANHAITLYPPITTARYGGGISWSEGTNTAASINAVDAGSGGALHLAFSTGSNSAIAERMRITSAGELQLTGNGVLRNQESGGNFSYLQQTSSDARLFVQYSQPLLFGTNNTERMRLDASGNFLVGTTSHIFGTNFLLNLSGSNPLALKQTSTAANNNAQVNWHVATTGDNRFVEFGTETSFTIRGSITYNRAGGLVAYNTTSDYRAKDIIGLIENTGSAIDALKVYVGKMKNANLERPMLIAHEAQEVAPYAVTGEKNAVNKDGTPKYQEIDMSSLVPLLIAEIQSLRARVAQLEGEN